MKSGKFTGILALLVIVSLVIAGCTESETTTSAASNTVPGMETTSSTSMTTETTSTAASPDDIIAIAEADGRFMTLLAALEAADLVETLKGEGPFTVFAPTDDAFDELPEGTIDSLLDDIPALTDILLYHVVEGKVMAADVVNLTEAETVSGGTLSITVEDSTVMINDAEVIIPDIETSNGVIHVIDSVLIPPEGEGDTTDTASVPSGEEMDIVDTAVADGRFTTLVAALEAADLVETLKGEGPFTVFAPTDDAFDELPEGTINSLLDDIPALTDILLYHVVEGEVMAADVVNLTEAETVSGGILTITVVDDSVMINDAEVIIPDIETSNGVIHVIDTVLIPE
jgi:uncharacterized surface protein with fasciclin (FAS1) repeats